MPGVGLYNLKNAGRFIIQYYEKLKDENRNSSKECDENLKFYSWVEERTAYMKEYETRKWQGYRWMKDTHTSEWEKQKLKDERENYMGNVQLSVSSSLTRSMKELESFPEEVVEEPKSTKLLPNVKSSKRDPLPSHGSIHTSVSKSLSTVPAIHPHTTKSRIPSLHPGSPKNLSKLKTQRSGRPGSASRIPVKHSEKLPSSVSSKKTESIRMPSKTSHSHLMGGISKSRHIPAAEVVTVSRGEREVFSPKEYEIENFHKIKNFFKNIDAVKSAPPDDTDILFQMLYLDQEFHKVWRMIGRYLLLDDDVLESINSDCNFVEEKSLRMLQEWKKRDESADILELVYALTNCRVYTSIKKTMECLPKISPDCFTEEVAIPMTEETLSELERLLVQEYDAGACAAEVILQGEFDSKPIMFRLSSMDRDGLTPVSVMCRGMATASTNRATLTINFIRPSKH